MAMQNTQKQKTVAKPVSFKGIGTHSGVPVTMTLYPAETNFGIWFQRIDLADQPMVQAHWSKSVPIPFCTQIRQDSVFVNTIEHLLAALAALEIDNLLIKIDGPEVPIMDGSAAPFISAIEKEGIKEEMHTKKLIRVLKPVRVEENGRSAELCPSSHLKIDFSLDFKGRDGLKTQNYSFQGSAAEFLKDVASARTFGFFDDAEKLWAAGFAKGSSLENAVVIKDGKPLNNEGFRYEDECVRHKVLDALGDLYLAGAPLRARYHGINAGHELNAKLLQELFADQEAWCFEESYPLESTVFSYITLKPVHLSS